MAEDWRTIEEAISAATGARFRVQSAITVAGGDINRAFSLEGSGQRYFLKLNGPGMGDMFRAEADALRAIDRARAVRVPLPLCAGEDAQQSWLVLEWLELQPGGKADAALLGEQLARMHQSLSDTFGWHRDNTIGRTPQINTASADWVSFYGRYRLGYQLELAASNGAGGALRDSGARLLELLGGLFTDYRPQPSLLHGDLWGGNWACTANNGPVIFDPATYYGDREADLAMTELFGGFDERFYQSYVSAWAIDPGYSTRKVLYNLYHVLNHFNLFGGGYAGQAQRMISSLLAEIT
ncbi:MAG: fructosamine kinase family protein [Halioglobus sp.]